MVMLWGQLGTQSLAAANLAWTWIHFTMVIIEGAQQALYSLVPQALGSRRMTELGTILTSALLWTCVVLVVPIACVWLRLGSIIEAVDKKNQRSAHRSIKKSPIGPTVDKKKIIDRPIGR